MAPFYLYKDLIFKCSHILRSWGSGHQYMNLGVWGDTIQAVTGNENTFHVIIMHNSCGIKWERVAVVLSVLGCPRHR